MLGILITFVTTPYLTRVLGKGCLGIDSYVLSVVQICQVMGSLGTTIYGNREIAYVRKNPEKLTDTFWELFFLRLSLGAIVGAIYLFIAFNSSYRIVFLIQTITLVSYYLDISWLYIGMEDVRPVTLYSAFAKITATAAVFMLIKKPEDLYLYVVIIALSQAVITILLFTGARGRIGRCSFGRVRIRRHLKPVLALFLPQAASSLYVLFDKTMIGLLASDVSRTSIYDKAEMIVKAPVVFATAMTTVMMPRIAHYYAENRNEDIKALVTQTIDLMLLLFVPISAGMAIVARVFIPIYLGPAYMDSVQVVWIMSSIILAIGLSNVSGAQFLIGCNETRYLAASYFTSAVFNITGNIFLIPLLDEKGASITTCVAEWMVVLIQFWAMHKMLGSIGIFSLAAKKVFAAAAMSAAIIPLYHFGTGVGVMLMQILVGAAVYFVLLLFMRDSGFVGALDMIKSMTHRQ